MKLSTFGRLVTLLLLVGAVAVGATGCVFVPYPAGGYYGHGDQGPGPYRR